MELEILQAIQKLGCDFCDMLFCGITVLGEVFIFIALIPLFYWCVDKLLGEELIVSLFASSYLNSLLKGIFARTRPISSEALRRAKYDYFYESLKEDNGLFGANSFPSGHSQSSAVFYGAIAFRKGIKKYWLLLLIPLLVGLSRLYLGVHWPSDVLAGLLLGIAVAALVHYSMKHMKKQTLILLPIIAALSALFVIGSGREQMMKTLMLLALLCGSCIGILTENKYIEFSTHDVRFWMRLARIPVGLAAVALTAGVIYIPFWICGASLDVSLVPVCFAAGMGLTTIAPIAFRMFRLN